MTSLLVPIALDALLVRSDNLPFAPTAMAKPTAPTHQAEAQRLLPVPFGTDLNRPRGAYLHWALPDGLTRAIPDSTGEPVFTAIPERWLVLRLTGDIRNGPREVTAWLLPDTNVDPPVVITDALHSPIPPVGPPPGNAALTVLGAGDLSWSAYYDNVVGRLAIFDPLEGVSGAISYLVCGWYTHVSLDPLNAVTDATLGDFLRARGWKLPDGTNASGGQRPTGLLCHGAAVGLGWPDPTWPGDGGILGVEAGGAPDGAAIDVIIADTIAEATAALGLDSGGQPASVPAQRLLAATVGGMLSELAHPSGPAALDTALHLSRFTSLPSDSDVETIWEPDATAPGTVTGPAAQPAAANGAAAGGPGLGGALAASRRLAGIPEPRADAQPHAGGPDVGGALVSAFRTTARVFAPADPVVVLRGAGRSFAHGGDGRHELDGKLACRLTGQVVASFRAAGEPPVDASTALPLAIDAELTLFGGPPDLSAVLGEVVSLDPSCAPDLSASTATEPSPDAAARAAWLDDPTAPTDAAIVGTLPSPIAIVPATKPWTPMHLEWQLDWSAASDGVHAFSLGDVDFDLPEPTAIPATEAAVPLSGRSLLSASPARIAAGGTEIALAHLRSHGLLADHPFAGFLAERGAALAAGGGRAAHDGLSGAAADQDLLSGSLEDFLAQLRGQNTFPVVRPPNSTADDPSKATNLDILRAGLAQLSRARVVDAFGQYVDLIGSSATTPGDGTLVSVGAGEAIPEHPGVVALVPRLNAKARVLLRYTDADGAAKDASTAVSPLCGFVLPSALDGSLEFFAADGTALGRIRPDADHGAAWEEDPGQPASFGRLPSSAIANRFLGALADGLLAKDTVLATGSAPAGRGQTALAALLQLIDTTRWTVDATGNTGDEHASLLLGHPISVMRAAIKVDVQGAPTHSNSRSIALPVKLGTLAHSQDGLLAYYVADDYTVVRAVDPAVGVVTPPGGSAITSDYVNLAASFDVQAEQAVPLTLLVVPGTDVHVTLGLLPQKTIGMRRDWVSTALAALTPNWRYGPVLLDAKVTRIPIAADVRGIWSWYHRPDPASWASETIVNADSTAVLSDDVVKAEHGWIRLKLQPDPQFPGIPVEVSCITKPIRDDKHRIRGIGGVNADNSRWWMTTDQAIQMVETGRFFFYVNDVPHKKQVQIVVGVSERGNKFLQTVGDADPTNDLGNLAECPPPHG
jgi:hypothetical protein